MGRCRGHAEKWPEAAAWRYFCRPTPRVASRAGGSSRNPWLLFVPTVRSVAFVCSNRCTVEESCITSASERRRARTPIRRPRSQGAAHTVICAGVPKRGDAREFDIRMAAKDEAGCSSLRLARHAQRRHSRTPRPQCHITDIIGRTGWTAAGWAFGFLRLDRDDSRGRSRSKWRRKRRRGFHEFTPVFIELSRAFDEFRDL
jgi:hypothetical protein